MSKLCSMFFETETCITLLFAFFLQPVKPFFLPCFCNYKKCVLFRHKHRSDRKIHHLGYVWGSPTGKCRGALDAKLKFEIVQLIYRDRLD